MPRWYDVYTLVIFWGSSYLQNTSIRAGAAAKQAKLNKRWKYDDLINDHIFVALVMAIVEGKSILQKKYNEAR